MQILVTGGAGFIGSEFVLQTAKFSKFEITVVDSLTYAARLENLNHVIDRVEFHQLDIRDEPALASLFKKKSFDFVVNFAAESHVDQSIRNPKAFLSTNVDGTLNLLKMCHDFSVSRYLQISTDEVYGSLKSGYATEDHKFNPSSPYSASKASAEHFTNSFFTTYGLNTGIVRCSNNYGPRQFPEKLIPLAIKALLEGKKVPVYGDGMNVREWIHVEDSVRGIIKVLEYGRPGRAYNISSGDFSNNLELIKKIAALMGRDESAITFVADRQGHDFRYAIDSSRISNELGWAPSIDLMSGLKTTVEWYLDNLWSL